MSRALGDFRYKERYDLHASLQKVTALPDIKIVQRSHLDEVLILACDGLWDVFSSEEGVQQVRELWAAGETDMALVVEEILDQSLLKGRWL